MNSDRSAAANKAWETRRQKAEQQQRSAAANKAWETRRRRAAETNASQEPVETDPLAEPVSQRIPLGEAVTTTNMTKENKVNNLFQEKRGLLSSSFSVEMVFPAGFAVSFAPDEKDSREYKNRVELPKLARTGYVPSSSVRGRLRHTAVRMIIESREKQGLPKLTLADVNWLAIGGIVQSKRDADEPTADMMQHRPICVRHIFSGFWGCAKPIFTESKLQIENALPAHPIDIDIIRGQRTDPLQRGEFDQDQVADPSSFEEAFNRLVKRQTDDKERKRAQKKEATGNGNHDNPEITKEIPVKEITKETPVNMPFSREIIPPNTRFNTTWAINNASELQIGLFVATLREFAERPVFGAQAGMNLGLVSLSLRDQDGNVQIAIDCRKWTFEVSPPLRQLEQQFWDAFPTIEFSIPVLKK